MKVGVKRLTLIFAFIIVLVASFGSLYFSEILKYVPCNLCWYQRLFMFALVFVLGVGIFFKDERVYRYAIPFSIVGWIIALYHNFIQYGWIDESIKVCNILGSCTERYLNIYGFVTIPLLSFIAFTMISICMFVLSLKTRSRTDLRSS